MADTHSVIGTKNKKGQTFTDTWKMMNDAPRTPSFYTGSEVIKEALRRASCDVMIAYPITPQSEAAALIGELFAEGYIGDYFRGESEFAVMSQCAGAAFGGASDARHLPRHQLAAIDPTGHTRNRVPVEYRDACLACGNCTRLLRLDS